MTLYNIVSILKSIAASQPNIRTTTDGSVYDALNTNPAIQYDVFHISQTNHREDENYDYYGFNLFYISRLEDSLEDNRLQIQSIGKEVLSNIIRTLCENFAIDYPTITYFPFTQRFNDLCAGVYCSLQLDVPKELWCADDYYAEVVPGSGLKLQDIGITITENGLRVITADAEYDGIGEIRIQTEVPQSAAVLQDKEVEYTENGSYSIHPDPAYDGLSSVSVDVLVPDRYDEGYDDGKTDGENEQKAKLTVTSFTENNTYTRADGWSAVTVDVPSDYEDGYNDGAADQKAKLVSTTVTQNGTYSREDGYSSIEVNVPQTGQTINNQNVSRDILASDLVYVVGHYIGNQTITHLPYYTGIEKVDLSIDIDASAAIEQGENQQKAKMVETAFTQNGTYTREDGYSAITVNVDDRYDEGYEDGYRAGAAACSGLLATAITLNVASAITDSGTATTTYSPSTAYTDIYYTSSDTSKATIDENTGEITVIANGTVTICTKDRLSGLQDCKSVSITKSPAPATSISINVPGTITDSATATTTVTPSSASTNLRYSSSDTAKATINATTGAISVKASGTVQFCVTDTISGLKSCKNANVRKSATAITINVPSTVTDSATATTTVSPTGATTNLTYTSSNTSRATINSTSGAITVKSNGSVQFCVKDSISNKQSCKTVNVVKSPVPATSITINVPTTVTDSATATTTVNPSTADTNITYTSSDTSIATVSSNGVITAKGNGTVTICANDSISGLKSCKTITIRKSGTVLNYTADTSTVDATGETRTITYDAIGFNDNSFGISISGATGATYTKNGNVFTITFPDNPSTSDRDYVVTLTATTYGGATKSATLYYTQKGKPAIVGTVMVIYNVTSKTQPTVVATTALAPYFTSVTVGGNTYPLPTTNGNGFTIMDKNGYKALGYTFSATGKQSITYNVGPNSPLVTGVYPSSDTDINGEGHFQLLKSLFSGYTTDTLVQANAAVEVNVGSGIKNIPADFFSDGCGYCGHLKLTAVTMANGVTYIGSSAFLGQHYLNGEIKIPASVTGMGQQLFYWTEAGTNTDGTSLPAARFTLKFLGTTPPVIKSTSFVVNANNKVMSNTIKVPSSAVSAYKTSGNWTYYANNIVGY